MESADVKILDTVVVDLWKIIEKKSHFTLKNTKPAGVYYKQEQQNTLEPAGTRFKKLALTTKKQ